MNNFMTVNVTLRIVVHRRWLPLPLPCCCVCRLFYRVLRIRVVTMTTGNLRKCFRRQGGGWGDIRFLGCVTWVVGGG